MDFKSYYENQIGSGLPVFYGTKYQRGHGLGSMFKSFFRWISPIFKTHALPVLKEGASVIGQEAVRTAANIANDTLSGKKIEEAAVERAKEAVDSISTKAQNYIKRSQTGSGYKRKKSSNKKSFSKRPSKKHRRLDIFDNLF
jgi:hypothetical protein